MEEITCDCGARFYNSALGSTFKCPKCGKPVMTEEEYIDSLLKEKRQKS